MIVAVDTKITENYFKFGVTQGRWINKTKRCGNEKGNNPTETFKAALE